MARLEYAQSGVARNASRSWILSTVVSPRSSEIAVLNVPPVLSSSFPYKVLSVVSDMIPRYGPLIYRDIAYTIENQ